MSQLTGRTVPPTPQSLLDDAVYSLGKKNGDMASECLWLCGSLALKNFSIAYGKDVKGHQAKNLLVTLISKQFGEDIFAPWSLLNV